MSRGQRTVQSSAWRRRVQGTNRLVCARKVQSQTGGGVESLRQKIKYTQLQFLGSARAARSVVVLPTPTGFRKSTRDAKTRSAVEEHTNEARGGGGGPGARRPGASPGQRPDSQQRSSVLPFHNCFHNIATDRKVYYKTTTNGGKR